MNKPVSARISDACFEIAGLLAPLLIPIGLIGIGQYVVLGLSQSRELLRNLLNDADQGFQVGIFFLAYVVWLLVCRELALKLLQRPGEHGTSSPLIEMVTAFGIRLVKLGVVAVAIYTAFSILKGEGTWTSLWPLAQVALVSAGIVLASFNVSNTRYSAKIPLFDAALSVVLIFAVFLVTGLADVTTLSWLTSKSPAPSFPGSSVPFWVPFLCASVGAALQAFASITSLHSHRWWALSVGLLLVALSALALPLEPAILLALGLAGIFPSAILLDSRQRNHPGRGGWMFALPALIGFASFGLLFTGYPASAGKWLGSMAILFIGLSVWSAFVAAIWCAIIFRQRALGVTVALIGAIIMSGAIDHGLRAELPKSGTQDQRPKIHDHYREWKKTLPDPETSPIFVVAASGGGLRAAYWTALLLAKLDDATCGQFSRHVYAYSGVSGGSLGVAAFEAQRVTEPKHASCEAWRGQQVRHFLGQDFLGSVIGSTVFAEPLQRLFFWNTGSDRGSVLADAWTTAWDESHAAAKGAFARPFLEVFDTKPTGDLVRPALFINATRVETGQRAVATNVQIPLPDIDDIFRISSLKRDNRLETHGLSVADTVLNSARFTYVSPAATVWGCFRSQSPTTTSDACSEDGVRHQLWGRLVDGGYFENSGLATLTEVMRELGVSDRTD
jgi:hypothetical protein